MPNDKSITALHHQTFEGIKQLNEDKTARPNLASNNSNGKETS